MSVCYFGNIFSLDKEYVKPQTFYDSLPLAPKKGTLYFKTSSDPKVINPILASDSGSGMLLGYLWMSLMTLDPQTLNYLPALAQSFSISADKKDYKFKLNPAAKWQDGTSVTADDFKFTLDSILNPKVHAAAIRSTLGGVRMSVIDKQTLIFHVNNPSFDTLFQLSLFVPIQKKQFEQSKDFNNDPGIMHPIGNGPYVLSKYERGSQIVFVRNKNWWGNGLSHFKNLYNIDSIILKIIPENTLAYERFIKGNLDGIPFTSEDWAKKVNGLDKDKFSFSPGRNKKIWALKTENKYPKHYAYLAWNEKNPIFKSVKTRMALSYLVNYKKLIDKVCHNLCIQTTSPFGSISLNSASDLRTSEKMIQFNKQKASSLLAQDGWKNENHGHLVKMIEGKKIPFIFSLVIPSQSDAGLKIAQILKEDLKSSGIILEIKTLEWNSFLDKVTEKREFDSAILSWTSTLFPNPKQIWHSHSQEEGGSNYIGYSNLELDNLILKANEEFDAQKRNLLLQNINRVIYADQPYTFLFEPKYVLEGLNSKIKSPHWVSEFDQGAASELFYLD